jgi:hypothetical protein
LDLDPYPDLNKNSGSLSGSRKRKSGSTTPGLTIGKSCFKKHHLSYNIFRNIISIPISQRIAMPTTTLQSLK